MRLSTRQAVIYWMTCASLLQLTTGFLLSGCAWTVKPGGSQQQVCRSGANPSFSTSYGKRVQMGLIDDQINDWMISMPELSGAKVVISESPAATLSELMASYYTSVASGSEHGLVVSPDASFPMKYTDELTDVLASVCSQFGGLYHPDNTAAPHLTIRHSSDKNGVFKNAISPLAGAEAEQALMTSVTDESVLEEVFGHIEKSFLRMLGGGAGGGGGAGEGPDEDAFIGMGRKLLTVNNYVIARESCEAALASVFWTEARNMLVQLALDQETGVASEPRAGLGGTGEKSTLIAAPGFANYVGEDFLNMVRLKLAIPLERLTNLGQDSPMTASIYAGGDFKYPIIILSPHIPVIAPPEKGYTVSTLSGEEYELEDYIQRREAFDDRLLAEEREKEADRQAAAASTRAIKGQIPIDFGSFLQDRKE